LRLVFPGLIKVAKKKGKICHREHGEHRANNLKIKAFL
jgi:hypothetical protein